MEKIHPLHLLRKFNDAKQKNYETLPDLMHFASPKQLDLTVNLMSIYELKRDIQCRAL